MDTFPKHLAPLLAFVIPGFVALVGLVPTIPALGQWFIPGTHSDAGWGSPLYVLLVSLGMGVIVQCFRWGIFDHVHEWMGIKKVKLDFSKLGDNLDTFNLLTANHYIFYQFYGGFLVASIWTYSAWRFSKMSAFLNGGTDLGMLIVWAVLFFGSRDALKKHRNRVSQLMV